MYEKDFKQIIHKLPNAFMLYGSCRLSISFNLEIIKSLDKSDERLVLRDSDYKLNTAIEYLSSNSLFSSTKLLIIELEKAISNKDLKELLAFVNNETKLIVALYEGKALKDLEKSISGNFVRFFDKKTPFEQLNSFREICGFYNIAYEPQTLEYLQKHYEFDSYKAGCELLKYKNQKLDLNTLKAHLDDENSISFEDFFDAFLNTKKPNDFINNILLSEDEISIINKFYANFLRLFILSANLKTYGKIDYKIALGYTPPRDICLQLEQFARKLSNKFEDIFSLLLDADYEIKVSSSTASNELMYSYLLKLYFLINS